MIHGLVHIHPLQFGLFPTGNNVDVVSTAQTMVHHAQQTVRAGWVIDTNRFAASRVQ